MPLPSLIRSIVMHLTHRVAALLGVSPGALQLGGILGLVMAIIGLYRMRGGDGDNGTERRRQPVGSPAQQAAAGSSSGAASSAALGACSLPRDSKPGPTSRAAEMTPRDSITARAVSDATPMRSQILAHRRPCTHAHRHPFTHAPMRTDAHSPMHPCAQTLTHPHPCRCLPACRA